MDNQNIQLSPKATEQLEGLIDVASFLTYPVRLVINGWRLFAVILLSFVLVVGGSIFWCFTAHRSHADQMSDFAKRQDMATVDFTKSAGAQAPFAIHVKYISTLDAAYAGDGWVADRSADLSKFFSYCNADAVKVRRWSDGYRWISDKSNVMMTAYLTGARNIDALRVVLAAIKAGESVPPSQSCTAVTGDAAFLEAYKSIVIPNAPVITFTHVFSLKSINAVYNENETMNLMTGMCVVGHCTDADLVPRNDSIFIDLVHPQMTAGQQEAIDALYATGTLEFWQAAAEANGIPIRVHAVRVSTFQQVNARDTRKATASYLSSDDRMMTVFEFAYIAFVLFVGITTVVYIRHKYREYRERRQAVREMAA